MQRIRSKFLSIAFTGLLARLLTRVLTALWFSSLSIGVTADTHTKPVTLLLYDDYPPFLEMKDGRIQGLMLDLVAAVLEDMHQPYQSDTYPFKRAILSAEKGQGMVVAIYKTPDRLRKLDFSDVIYTDKTVLFVRNESDFEYNNIYDLRNQRIGVKLGWSYGSIFDQASSSQLFDTTTATSMQLYRMLDDGRLDIVADNEISGLGVLTQLNLQDKIKSVPNPLLLGDIFVAVKKGTDAKLLSDFNAHLKNIQRNGTYKKILNRYNADTGYHHR